MKRMHLFMIVVAGYSFTACAQEIPQNQIPSVVLNAFNKEYPNAIDADWEKKGELYYIEFDLAKRDHEVWIDASGKITKHEEEIPKSELPATVKNAIDQQFKEYRIDDVKKIEKDGKTYYDIELEGHLGDRRVVFDTLGNHITDTGFLY